MQHGAQKPRKTVLCKGLKIRVSLVRIRDRAPLFFLINQMFIDLPTPTVCATLRSHVPQNDSAVFRGFPRGLGRSVEHGWNTEWAKMALFIGHFRQILGVPMRLFFQAGLQDSKDRHHFDIASMVQFIKARFMLGKGAMPHSLGASDKPAPALFATQLFRAIKGLSRGASRCDLQAMRLAFRLANFLAPAGAYNLPTRAPVKGQCIHHRRPP